MRSCDEHLKSEQPQIDGSSKPYYKSVSEDSLNSANQEIMHLIEEGLDNEYIDKDEFEAMDPTEQDLVNFTNYLKFIKNTRWARPLQKGLLSVVVVL